MVGGELKTTLTAAEKYFDMKGFFFSSPLKVLHGMDSLSLQVINSEQGLIQ